jgi:hypothetical protein
MVHELPSGVVVTVPDGVAVHWNWLPGLFVANWTTTFPAEVVQVQPIPGHVGPA